MPVILATLEAEIGLIIIWGQPGQKFHKTSSQPKAGHTCTLIIPAMQEAAIRKTEILSQSRLKILETPISMEKSWV
jgi:hypothetical protein